MEVKQQQRRKRTSLSLHRNTSIYLLHTVNASVHYQNYVWVDKTNKDNFTSTEISFWSQVLSRWCKGWYILRVYIIIIIIILPHFVKGICWSHTIRFDRIQYIYINYYTYIWLVRVCVCTYVDTYTVPLSTDTYIELLVYISHSSIHPSIHSDFGYGTCDISEWLLWWLWLIYCPF